MVTPHPSGRRKWRPEPARCHDQEVPSTIAPSADDFRALARSSPWRFTTLHWTSRDFGRNDETDVVEAWLRRPGHLTVRDGQGVHVVEGTPYGTPVRLERPASTAAPGPFVNPGLAPRESEPVRRAAPATAPRPVLRPDGLVDERPSGYHYEHGDPMWQNYRWTAMLDPEELSHHVDLADVHAAERTGRLTWWATATPQDGYDPRCGCCPLLLGRVSVELEYGPFDDDSGRRGWETAWEDLPSTYLVGLDVQTGIVVDITPLDGTGGTRLGTSIHSVDAALIPPRATRDQPPGLPWRRGTPIRGARRG